MFISEHFVNATESVRIGESDVFEAWTDSPGQLFRSLQKEYGACKSKVYIDGPDNQSIHVGWIFRKRVQYQDCDEAYLQEVWVTVHEKPDTKTREVHYLSLETGLPAS
jgi:hypothetical protein